MLGYGDATLPYSPYSLSQPTLLKRNVFAFSEMLRTASAGA
jgi:hypothetical protein